MSHCSSCHILFEDETPPPLLLKNTKMSLFIPKQIYIWNGIDTRVKAMWLFEVMVYVRSVPHKVFTNLCTWDCLYTIHGVKLG